MSSPHAADRHSDGHLDQGELADELAGVGAPAAAAHLVSCRDCSARLSALATASAAVVRDLQADPEPVLPPAVAHRITRAIAAESAARAARSPLVSAPTASTSAPARPPHRREGWWARHTRLGGALVTAAALVVVGGGGAVVANWAGGRPSNTQATSADGPRGSQEDSATPRGDDRSLAPSPLGAAGSATPLHRSAFVGEVADLLHAGARIPRKIPTPQVSCIDEALAGSDLEAATLTALAGTFTLDGRRVLVVVAAHDGTRTALAISGCPTDPTEVTAPGTPAKVAARGDLP